METLHEDEDATDFDADELSRAWLEPRPSSQSAPVDNIGKCKLLDGHVGVAGSLEMPTVLEFEGLKERLFVWRYRRAWCVKTAKPREPSDAATAPPLLGGAKKPPAVPKPGEFKPPEVQEWRSVATLYADSCLKSSAPRSRSHTPSFGNAPKPTFIEKTVELGRTMQEPQSGWKPAGVAPAWGDTSPAWGSWGPPWGQKLTAKSRSLPTLRADRSGKQRRTFTKVATTELNPRKKVPPGEPIPEKEFRFVARAMAAGALKPDSPVSLETAIAERRRLGEWRPRTLGKFELPSNIGDLIGYGDVLFEPPDAGSAWSGHGSTTSVGTDSRSALHDSSTDTMLTTSLPDLLPKAKGQKNTRSSPMPPPRLTRAATEREAARSLARSATRLQHVLSPVKASIEHMLL